MTEPQIHVLGLPQAPTTREHYVCGFVPKIKLFCDMMVDNGYDVILYGHERCEARVAENVMCITEKERAEFLGEQPFWNAYWTLDYAMWREMNTRQAGEVSRRKRPGDFLCMLGGTTQRPVWEANQDLRAVEFGVGYAGPWTRAIVWESRAWRQYVTGSGQLGNVNLEPRWLDTTIWGYVDENDLPFVGAKGEYLLYCGRVIPAKGLDVAVKVAAATGRQLIVCGPKIPGVPCELPDSVDYRGIVSVEERAALMGGAHALICPTTYIEPFGTIQAEAMMCGTPVIATDWGSFPEVIAQGHTGFACSSLQEFSDAVRDCGALEPQKIRDYAVSNFGLEQARVRYAKYFEHLTGAWDTPNGQMP